MTMHDNALMEKLERVREVLDELQSVAVAFSAGADSTFVLKVALDVLGRNRVAAVTGRSDSLARAEFEQARDIAERLGAEHVVLRTDEFQNPAYLRNPINRCFHCKTTLYAHMRRFMEERGFKTIVNGINVDDLGDFRPGIEAAREHGVRSPAAEAGLTKADIRALSRKLGLPTHDKPASPCLSSRVPYGEPVTPEKLRMIEDGEAFLRDMGVPQCRVRHHGRIARIEVPTEFIPWLADPEHAGRVDHYFRTLGFQYVSVDLKGFRSGSLNEVIAFGAVQPQF